MHLGKTKVWLEIIIVILVLVSGALFVKWQTAKSDLAYARESASEIVSRRDRTTQFLKDFVGVVLRANGDIVFEARLKLENAARAIGSPEILAKWQAFTKSKTEADAQKAVIDLLEATSNELTPAS